MLLPKDAAQYGDTLNNIVSDFIRRMCFLRQSSPTGDLVTDMALELYRFSLEGVRKHRVHVRSNPTPLNPTDLNLLSCSDRLHPAGDEARLPGEGNPSGYARVHQRHLPNVLQQLCCGNNSQVEPQPAALLGALCRRLGWHLQFR